LSASDDGCGAEFGGMPAARLGCRAAAAFLSGWANWLAS